MADKKKSPPPVSTGDPLLDALYKHREMMPPGGKYDTQLSDQELDKYTAWVVDQSRKLGRDLSKDEADYDLRGWFKENGPVNLGKGAHFPDTYKKPTHPTFSEESKYSGKDGQVGGKWGKDASGKDTFTPSRTNLKNLSPQQLKEYFERVEPNGKLILPLDAQMYPTMKATQ